MNFLSGGTGFLGANLAVRLLQENSILVVLSRHSKKLRAVPRFYKALSLITGKPGIDYNNLIIFEGDVTEDLFDLKENNLRAITKVGIDEVWHSAGSISFSEKEADRKRTEAINVNGMINMLKLVEKVGAGKIHYIGTAYSDGNKFAKTYQGETLPEFNNPYERSKNKSEKILLDWSHKHPEVEVYIYKPSIVIGDKEHGRAFNFSGYYRYMQVFYHIRQMFVMGRKTVKGVRIDSDGVLHLPIMVPGVYDAEINMITIDHALDLIMAIRQSGIPGIYPIVNESPPIYGELLKNGLRFLKIDGVNIIENVNAHKPEKEIQRIESMIGRGMVDYLPYISQTFKWDTSITNERVAKDLNCMSCIDYPLVSKILQYAVENNFEVKV